MKKLLTLALALVALAVFTGVAVAQQKGEEKKPTTAPVMEQRQTPKRDFGDRTGPIRLDSTPAAVQKRPAEPAAETTAVDKASPEGRISTNMSIERMTGKVTKVGGNSFTIVAKGKQKTFLVGNFKTLPKVGEIIDITYTQKTPSGPMEATTINTSKSNTY